MTLHEAIALVLNENNQPMTANNIAREINSRELYQRGDRDPIPSSQIHARVNKRPHLFYKEKVYGGNDLIGLIQWQNGITSNVESEDLPKSTTESHEYISREKKTDSPSHVSAAEATRAEYRPAEIKVLFVGESPPAGGTFFYYGNSNLARYIKEAFEAAFDRRFPSMNAFLEYFMEHGCYLDDLCLVPVNNMNKKQRGAERQRGVAPMADRITNYNPDYIVVVMKAIEGNVFSALYRADLSSVPTRALPFPSHGNQRRYVNELVDTLRGLQEQDLFAPRVT